VLTVARDWGKPDGKKHDYDEGYEWCMATITYVISRGVLRARALCRMRAIFVRLPSIELLLLKWMSLTVSVCTMLRCICAQDGNRGMEAVLQCRHTLAVLSSEMGHESKDCTRRGNRQRFVGDGCVSLVSVAMGRLIQLSICDLLFCICSH